MSIAMSAAEPSSPFACPPAPQALRPPPPPSLSPSLAPSFAPAEASVAPNGKLRENGLAETDRSFALAIHLSPFAGMMLPLLFLAPVVLWLIRKDHSRFVDDHGREMTNVLINSVIITVAAAIFSLPVITLIITIPAVAIWYVVIIISQIRAAVAASKGEYFRYPMVMRFLT